MSDSAVRGLIGIANRARKLVSGTFPVQKCVKSGRAKLVLMDEGASSNTQSDLRALCHKAGVPLKFLPSGELEQILGDYRVCCAVTDENFSAPLIKYLT